jgi:hypothetical protein
MKNIMTREIIQPPLLPIVNTPIADDKEGMGFEPMHAGQGYVAILVQESVGNSLGDLL